MREGVGAQTCLCTLASCVPAVSAPPCGHESEMTGGPAVCFDLQLAASGGVSLHMICIKLAILGLARVSCLVRAV